MGLFGGLFGGGGGGSTTTTSTTTVEVKPVTNIDIPLDELAGAIETASLVESQTNLETARASLELQKQLKQVDTMTQQQLKKAELEQLEQLKKLELGQNADIVGAELEQQDKKNKRLILLSLLALTIYTLKKGK